MTHEQTARAIVGISKTYDNQNKPVFIVRIGSRSWEFRSEEAAVIDREWWVEQFAAALAAEQEDLLARLYRHEDCRLHVAKLCDEELDRSGALLGRVREQAAAIRKETT